MTISYKWLSEYLPGSDENLSKPSPEKLSRILTSIGLEVESLTKYESVKGGLEGLVIGEVIECIPHPNADKLKLTKVNIGLPELLSIVCGASNVAVGQKVIVAPVGTTIFPSQADPIMIKIAKIRGIESQGMICAEDEIGLGTSHAGIIVLGEKAKVGLPATSYFHPYEDHIFEIGLTPNHMDAMSHLGVARDVCAYLSLHEKGNYKVKIPALDAFSVDNNNLSIQVNIENKTDCGRYSGLCIAGISIAESPVWMQEKLRAIGVRPINNIVDITNFVLHETGQPLHAFDADTIKGNKIIVKNLPSGTKFVTLDEKVRILHQDDLMICNAEEPMCIAGVFGGLHSGINDSTKNIFLESAWFNPVSVRKTSFRHGLRTDAATHFEKGMDISNTVIALKRAALLIKELAGGKIASNIVDEYPGPKAKAEIILKYDYLKKLSGKDYQTDTVKKILESLGFDILKGSNGELLVGVPYHKPDITLPADLVEEIMRIDGYDNIDIPISITVSPSVEINHIQSSFHQKTANYLVGSGFNEIFTNSITNSAYFSDNELKNVVKMINNLSAELNIMRPSLLETGLETIAYNINRKNNNLRFFEFGKTYNTTNVGQYEEENHLCLYITGALMEDSWKTKSSRTDFYYLKGICSKIMQQSGLGSFSSDYSANKKLKNGIQFKVENTTVLEAGEIHPSILGRFDIKQPVFFADFYWDKMMQLTGNNKIEFHELPKQLPVYRDLAMVVKKSLPYNEIERAVHHIGLNKLQKVQLFDIFESEKLGVDKKSLAISFTFMDDEKTLTDKEIDQMMSAIMKTFESELNAEIRK
jgi:phenylalanyl-tRNA synthetase beta chain